MDLYQEFFLIYWEKFEKSGFFKKKCMFILRNSQCEGSSPVRRELPGGNWEESFSVVRRELPDGKRASLLGRVPPGWKRASRWEGSFLVGIEFPGAVGNNVLSTGKKNTFEW